MYKLVIGNKRYSSWSLRPWLYMKERGIAFEEIRVPLYQGDYKAQLRRYAPTGKVPVLIEGAGDGAGDGAMYVWETIAIFEHLADRHPKMQTWPTQLDARSHARTLAAEMHAGFQALRTNCTMNVLRQFPAYIQTMLALPAMREWQAGAATETEVLPQFEYQPP